MSSSNNVSKRIIQKSHDSAKLLVPVQPKILVTETLESMRETIKQMKVTFPGLLENLTQGSSSNLNIRDGINASINAVNEIQKGTLSVGLKSSFIDSLKEKATRDRSSPVTSGIQAQWQSHREVKQCFDTTPFSHLRGCVWH